jgi:TonB family protein
MGDSAQNDIRRGYARPGEIDKSLLDAESLQKRQSVAQNPKSGTPVAGSVASKSTALHPAVELNPSRLSPRPVTGIVGLESIPLRQGAELKPSRGSLADSAGIAESKLTPFSQSAGQNPGTESPSPTRIVESKSTALRPGAELQPSRRSLADPIGIGQSEPIPVRQGVGLEVNRKSPALPARALESKAIPYRQGVEPHRNRSSSIPLTGRDAIRRRTAVTARFALLPDRKMQWGRIGLSAVGQLAFLGFLLACPIIFPQTMQTALKFDVIELMQPVTEVPVPPPTPPPPKVIKIKPKVRPPEPKPVVPEPVPELNPRQPHIFVVPKPALPKVHTVDVKLVDLKPNLEQTKIVLLTDQPKPPKEDPPVKKVQTGGFGDPVGILPPGNPNRAGNLKQAGLPQLPSGPGVGNGTSGAQGARATVATDGAKGAPATAGVTAGVDILSMPHPVYSTEGRSLRMEGDVVLEVVFLASGEVQVIRVLNGLGHGLDEAAIEAAKQIHFKPAKRDGRPFDFPARMRIEFRLAK